MPIHSKQLDELAINTIRFLSADGVQKANSGHPGMPMACAPIVYVLYSKYMKHNPANPNGLTAIVLFYLPDMEACCFIPFFIFAVMTFL